MGCLRLRVLRTFDIVRDQLARSPTGFAALTKEGKMVAIIIKSELRRKDLT